MTTPEPVSPPSGWASSPEPGSPDWLAAPWSWYFVPRPVFTGDNQLTLLRGGAELFPAMIAAIDAAQHEVWLASYICEPDGSVLPVLEALERAARRGVQVRMVVDGFGSKRSLAELQQRLPASGVA
ncbi:MAG: phosphatidylserine/phosphatidylglycerophosphate/cardiolipin synthase family protein, partial [Leptothrix sp. (in: b-proteobacteria)]